MQEKLITEKIIGCAYNVYNTMGFGFLESVYEKCLLIELRKAGLQAVAQEPITVRYDGQEVGETESPNSEKTRSTGFLNILPILLSCPKKSVYFTFSKVFPSDLKGRISQSC